MHVSMLLQNHTTFNMLPMMNMVTINIETKNKIKAVLSVDPMAIPMPMDSIVLLIMLLTMMVSEVIIIFINITIQKIN